jgi:hypothetical protein
MSRVGMPAKRGKANPLEIALFERRGRQQCLQNPGQNFQPALQRGRDAGGWARFNALRLT